MNSSRRNKKSDLAKVFHATADTAGKTLAAALRTWLPDESWSQVRRQIESRRVQINGNLCLDENRRLHEGEVVKVLEHSLSSPPSDRDIRVRHVDEHVVVVEKPAGMTTLRHPEERHWPRRRKQQQPTLDETLPVIISRMSTSKVRHKGKALPVRAVHRLDRETSGLMIFALSMDAERKLVQQFRRHTIHRRYIAIAHGDVAAQTITTQLVRDRGDGRRGSTDLPDVGKLAVTHVRPLERLNGYTVVECRLETGRTHQIRIHLSERGHLVCGDKVYCQPLFRPPIVDTSGAPRLALHAAELGFVHPISGEEMRFRMPFPEDLTELLNRLRRAKSPS
jgi:23S rRNA pseudouridine1911/1915/1917 synthase